MNITYESVEVSTPFFHENNTAAMNSYETSVQSMLTDHAVTASQDPVINFMEPPVTSEGPWPTEGPWPSKDPMDTSPIPWRWENRHDMPLEERGRCFFHSIPTNHHPTPTCLLHERDVIDNGTLTCLRSFDYRPEFFSASTRHCLYVNATMRAVVNVLEAYQQETCGYFIKWIGPVLAVIYLLTAWVWPIFYMIEMRKEENPLRYAIHKLSMWLPFRLACLPFMIFVCNWLEYRLC